MKDIILLLKNVYSGLDGISVRGLDNQDMLLSCAKGVRSAIAGLEALQEAQMAAKALESEEAADGR